MNDRTSVSSVDGLADVLRDIERQFRDADYEVVIESFREFMARERLTISPAQESFATTWAPLTESSPRKSGNSRIPIVTESLQPSLIHESHPNHRTSTSSRGLLFGTDFETTSLDQERTANVPTEPPVRRLEKELDRLVNQIADQTIESLKPKS